MSKITAALQKEPVLAVATLVAIALGAVGIVVDANAVFVVLTALLPLLGGAGVRQKVTPVINEIEKVAGVANEVVTDVEKVAPAVEVVVKKAEEVPAIAPIAVKVEEVVQEVEKDAPEAEAVVTEIRDLGNKVEGNSAP